MTFGYKFSWSDMEILKQTWETIAKRNNGTFKIKNVRSFANTNDPTLRYFELTIPFADNNIVLLSTELKPLKVSCKFKSELFLEFLIYPEDYTDKISKLFGLKEIEIGDPKFDPKFIIKGNNAGSIKKLLTLELREFLIKNYISNFKMEKSEGISTLEMNISVKELEFEVMQNVIQTFKDCITIINQQNNLR